MADSVYNSEHSGRALTIAHVAQSAGVSSTTASLGLRDDPRVKAATRKRILAAAAKLGYRTNAAARALASRIVPYIGMITGCSTPQGANSGITMVYLPLLFELGRILEERDFHLVFGSDQPYLNVPGEQMSFSAPKLLQQRHVSGILVLNDIWPALYQAVTRWNVPCVGVKASSFPGIPVVSVDYRLGAVEAVNYLVELGHRRIAFFPEPKASPAVANKVTLKAMGYVSAMHQAGLELMPGWDAELETSEAIANSYAQMLARMIENNKRPTAILSYDDFTARLLGSVLAEQGLRVPQDVSILSLEDDNIGHFNVPATTCVGAPWRELAENSVDMLLNLINGKKLDSYEKLLLPRLIARESTSPPSS